MISLLLNHHELIISNSSCPVSTDVSAVFCRPDIAALDHLHSSDPSVAVESGDRVETETLSECYNYNQICHKDTPKQC